MLTKYLYNQPTNQETLKLCNKNTKCFKSENKINPINVKWEKEELLKTRVFYSQPQKYTKGGRRQTCL